MSQRLTMRGSSQFRARQPLTLRRLGLASLAVGSLLTLLVPGTAPRALATEDGVALAIVYDTSGSMNESVSDASGRPAPKYVIANRALQAVATQVERFATNTTTGAPRKVETGLFIFHNGVVQEAVKFGPFDDGALRQFARTFKSPAGNTPLGSALGVATHTVFRSALPRKHVLLITDGMNTTGPRPEDVLPRLQHQAGEQQTSLSVHFIAFDVDAQVFAPMKKLGATVVGAADEKQLNSQLDFILQRKILLEEEEPPVRKSQ